MYLKRKIDDYLKNWKISDEKFPLIVKGARQIGKTVGLTAKNVSVKLVRIKEQLKKR